MFCANFRMDKQRELSEVLGVTNDLRLSNYLGLSLLIGRSEKSVFNFLKDYEWKRIQGWSAKLLLKSGKVGPLRNVVQEIPSYCVSFFLIHKTFCKEI